MIRINRLLVAVSLVAAATAARAQSPADPSGHWEGSLQAGMEVRFEIDFAHGSDGALVGTISIRAQQIVGLPLINAAMSGTSVTFAARSDQPFAGALLSDGKTITGTFSAQGTPLAFRLTRTGDARLPDAPRGPKLGADLEGTWMSTLAGMNVELILANHADGSGRARIVNHDQGDLQIPMLPTQKASSLTLETTVVAGSFAGTLNADTHEINGSWTQGGASVPVTFRRVSGR